ncbi:MAG TPA: cupin domain-containing protein [Blastocatellia bacterium]|nr:cupin domain-containing protein [Blastocatellia bacterium]
MEETNNMNSIAPKSNEGSLPTFLPARNLANAEVPWVPLAEGKSFKPLRFLSGNRGFVELLRLEPGTFSPLHRHTGEVHAFNLEGSRELCTGEVINPGDYVYEPAGNTDTWKVVGDVPLVVLVVVMGAVELIGPDDTVTDRITADTLMEAYQQHCAANGIQALDLVD